MCKISKAPIMHTMKVYISKDKDSYWKFGEIIYWKLTIENGYTVMQPLHRALRAQIHRSNAR